MLMLRVVGPCGSEGVYVAMLGLRHMMPLLGSERGCVLPCWV